MNRVKKYTFTLTGVNIYRINSTYKISTTSTETLEEEKKIYLIVSKQFFEKYITNNNY